MRANRWHLNTWACLLGVLGVAVRAAAAQESPPEADQPPRAKVAKPTQAVPRGGCVTTDCHPGVKAAPFTHGPVGVDACDACHKETDPSRHAFEWVRQGAELCGFCHQLELDGKHVHQPVAEGQCVQCHSPHGGANRFMLRGGAGAAVCAECHEDVTEGQPVVHGPVAAGACTACHRAHSSDHEHLLVASGRDLCVDCHQTLKKRLETVRTIHGPAAVDCTTCHRPHASAHPMMLTERLEKLCLDCHTAVGELIATATVKHAAVSDGRSCRNCHDPHGSDYPAVLVSNMLDVCLSCHDREVKLPDGTRLINMRAVLKSGRNLHGPIAQGDCAGACHQVHGGDNFRLLTEKYPPQFYAPFREESYALCFACHDRQLVYDERTTRLTNFRNGDHNMHYLHVNRKHKGRTCRACHETHASSKPKHIRDSVPFGSGGWKLPINFEITETGGGCSPGCHRPYGYDRVTPIENVPPAPPAPTSPDAVAAPTPETEPQ